MGPTVLAAVQATQDAILSFHSITHIPWYLIIPALAVGINVVFRQPFAVYTRKIMQRRREFDLVLLGWSWRIHRDTRREAVPAEKQHKEVLSRLKKEQSRIYNKMGLQTWRFSLGLFGLPFWILGIDSVRRICGGPRGILGSFITGQTDDAALDSGTHNSIEATTSPADIATTPASQVSVFDTNMASSVAEHVRDLPDPSIAWEGCLWFTDLSIADPFYILPLALSAVLVANMLPNTSAGRQQLFGLGPSAALPTTKGERSLRFRRMLLCAVALIGPATADLPAAIHLYWLSSALTHMFATKILSYIMPFKNSNLPEVCKDRDPLIILPKRGGHTIPQSKQQATKR